jgi:hypothetical protein
MHAVVEHDEEEEAYVVRDAGSKNGVLVNDEARAVAVLGTGDRISVGGREFVFLQGDEETVRRLFLAQRRPSPPETERSAGTDEPDRADPKSAFAGSVSEFRLGELLQALERARKTGRLDVVCSEGRGEIWFESGKVVRAALGQLANEEAVYRMLELDSGFFEFESGPCEARDEIQVPTNNLIMEGFRRIDEAARDARGHDAATETRTLPSAPPQGSLPGSEEDDEIEDAELLEDLE